MRIRLGHSPDADDAFIFWALATGRVETNGWTYEHRLEEIAALNDRALKGEYEVTALSLAAYPAVAGRYALLGVGASVGDGYGPVLVVPRERGASGGAPLVPAQAGRGDAEIASLQDGRRSRIAVPGATTTAALALRLWAREARIALEEVPLPFDAVTDALAGGAADAALLIHEGQVTFAEDGLAAVVDLGAWWRGRTGLPLPLGLNAARRDLGADGVARVAQHIRDSIRIGLERRDEALDHALRYGRGLGRDLIDRFVGMYVNDETVSLSGAAREAARRLLAEAADAGLVPRVDVEFVDP